MSKFTLKKEYISYVSVTLFGLLMSALAVSAASTISTNISTAGTLTLTTSTALNSILSTNGSGVVVGTSTPTFGNLIATSATLASTFGYNVGIASTSPYVALGVTGTTTSSAGMVIGALGTPLVTVLKGTCTLTTTVGRLPLSTTSIPFTCIATNEVAGDQAFVSLQSDGGSLAGSGMILLTYVKASSTAGFLEVGLSFRPGLTQSETSTSSFTGVTSTVPYFIVR